MRLSFTFFVDVTVPIAYARISLLGGMPADKVMCRNVVPLCGLIDSACFVYGNFASLQMKAWEKQQDSIKAAKKAGLSKKKAEDKAKDDKAKKGILKFGI
jgi:hypothetical protein